VRLLKLAKLLPQIVAGWARFGRSDLRFDSLLLLVDTVVEQAGFGRGPMHARLLLLRRELAELSVTDECLYSAVIEIMWHVGEAT
jgi:hypothetical protein